jgi:hypothetical protein
MNANNQEYKPRNGVWGNAQVWNSYLDLKREIENLIPDHTQGLHIKGAASKCKAKVSAIILKAKILEGHVKAVCVDYK